ncbi:MAG: hypothetical protein IJP50_03675 [Paludibacteraceae bacterium]|nr:hypothetical protein [Paludibacteraceae bacterium]
MLKHKLQWILLLVMLLGVSQGVWGNNEYNRHYLYVDCSSFTSYSIVNVKYFWDYNCTDKGGEYYNLPTLSNATYVHYYDLTGIGSHTYIRGFKVSQGTGWNDEKNVGVVNGQTHNCINVTGWGSYSWKTYVQKPSYSSLTVTNAVSGSGTAQDPYLVYAGTSFTMSSSASLPRSGDSDMAIRYYHGSNSSGDATSSSSTASITASSTVGTTTTYYGRVRGQYTPDSNAYSDYATNKSVVVRTIEKPVYTVGPAFGDWNTFTEMTKVSDGVYSQTVTNVNSQFKFTQSDGWDDQGLYNASGWEEDSESKQGIDITIGTISNGTRGNSQIGTCKSNYTTPVTFYINTSTKKMWAVATLDCVNPQIGSDPASGAAVSACASSAPTLSVTASSGNAPLTYQWYQNTENNNTTGSPVTDALTAAEGGASYTPDAFSAGTPYYYYCIVRSAGDCATSYFAKSNVSKLITIKDTPLLSPTEKTVKQYEPVKITSTNTAVDWAITTPAAAPSDGEYYLYDETRKTVMFKGEYKASDYVITATPKSGSGCTVTSKITVEKDDDDAGCP